MPRSSASTTRHALAKPQEQLRRRRALDLTRRQLKVTHMPPEVGELLRPLVPKLAERLSTRIQAEVSAYAGSASGRRHELIESAVRQAAEHFLDILENRITPEFQIHEVFRSLGIGEARDGHNLDAMRAAYQVVTRELWDEFHAVPVRNRLPNEHAGTLSNAIYMYLQDLLAQVKIGHAAASGGAQACARRNLLTALITPTPAHEIERLANSAKWQLPESARVLVAQTDGEHPLDAAEIPEHILVRAVPGRATFIIDGTRDDPVAELGQWSRRRVACSWPVAIPELPDAHRWTLQALKLVTRGVIEDAPVIDCFQHRQVIWLHAEPTLSAQLHDELLAPLMTTTPYNRLNLAITLMLWLQTKASAPTIAHQLGVHEHTVYNRLRRLHELFGPRLEDPEETLALLMALETVVPQWRAERKRTARDCGSRAGVVAAASIRTVSATATRYGTAGHVTVKIPESGAEPDSGNVTLTGVGTTQTKALSTTGTATFTLPRTLAPRSYVVSVTYRGKATDQTSTHHATLRVIKTMPGVPTIETGAELDHDEVGEATITVATPPGLATATGRVTLALKLGVTTQRITGVLTHGKATITLPKLAKGRWKLSATYGGNAYYTARTSKTLTIRVK